MMCLQLHVIKTLGHNYDFKSYVFKTTKKYDVQS